MTDTQTASAPDAEALLGDSDTVHVVCCEDDSLTLCGVDATEFEWSADETGCVVCAELSDTGFCPRGYDCG